MNNLFVFACYFNIENPVIFDAIKSVRKFYPNSDIVVVDSGSKDKSYFKFLKINNVIIEDINNRNYDTGAYWYAFKKYRDNYEYFYFFHDSIILKDTLKKFQNNMITSVRYFYSHDALTELYISHSLKELFKKLVTNKFKISNINPDLYGFDTLSQKEWVETKLKDTKYFMPKYFTGLFGPMMIIHKNVMEILLFNNIDKILPTNKGEQKAMERIFGIIFSQEGFDINIHSLQGNHLMTSLLSEQYIKKIILNRN